jgi:ribose 5-phosphate isomerase B
VRIAIASDHAGLFLKQALVNHLRTRGFDVDDLGPHETASVDYPEFARRVTDRLAAGASDKGILVCGTGMGMSIAANKMAGIRAALCTNELLARMARAHNDANVLCLGERVVGSGLALAIADAFIDTPFEGGRHQRRVDLITSLGK